MIRVARPQERTDDEAASAFQAPKSAIVPMPAAMSRI
jgi:hypothetical protein